MKESERDTGRLWAGGCKEIQTVRQPERKERKAERQEEDGGGEEGRRRAERETREDKKVVRSQLLFYDDLLSHPFCHRYSQTLFTTGPHAWLLYKVQKLNP